MKINELAELAGVSTEMVRKYRERNLVLPERNESNGYYDYSKTDFMNLLFIRKMRGAGIGLDHIQDTMGNSDAEIIGTMLDTESQRLEKEIRRMQRSLDQLNVVRAHYDLYRLHREEIAIVDAFDVKIDTYFGDTPDPVVHKWVQQMDLFTQVLHIRKEVLEAEVLPEKIPIEVGVGSYESILKEYELEMPEKVMRFPLGRYATAFVSTENMETIDRSEIQPLVDYVRNNHLKFDSDTTAFLFRVEHSNNRAKCIFRLRIKVVEAE